ncbi:PAS domain S-box protein [Massilia sp. ST3]|uniref:PAS domain-containing hybrid sensor histidine kinase/response regulator n=1 Tax=Massilia sp. ST3 TaxID=2824903 RepID=UPI001B82635F|nr:PAS domain S-box protein [Massilia sp. ST3]MBQ5946824.1 PAS domain S-box protein [Massilia sp. ST3]
MDPTPRAAMTAVFPHSEALRAVHQLAQDSPVPMGVAARAGVAIAPNAALRAPLASLREDAAGRLDALVAAVMEGRAAHGADTVDLPGGGCLRLQLSPVREADGAIAGVLCVGQPVQRDTLERLVESSLVGVVRYRHDGAVSDCNQAFLAMLGLERADVTRGLSWRALTPDEWVGADEASLVQLRASGAVAPFEKEFYHRDGSRVPVFVGAAADEDDRSRGVAFVLDISAMRHAERAFADIEAKFKAITNAMPQMVWSTLPDGFHDYYNDQWYAFTGVTPGETDGEKWNGMFHPEDQGLARDKWRHSLATGEPYEVEYRLRHYSGAWRWVLGRALPVRGEDGAIRRWMGTCTDIHEQKLTQEALREADQRKDEFLAMLGHELRNPLAPVRTAASLLPLAKGDPARIEHIGRVIGRQTAHMTGLIDDLLDVSRVTRGMITLDREDIALRLLVDEAAEQARPLVEARSHLLAIADAAGYAMVHGDRKRLVQVLSNLLSNAAKYTPAGGRIELAMRIEGGFAEIAVRDNGIGMSPELVASAFELFRQGKRTPDRSQGGLGIGLALVRSLVQLHGGGVAARSEGEGKGSEVVVRLPLHRPPAVKDAAVPDAQAVPAGASLRVMVVDDNADSAELAAMFLRAVGHEVAIAYRAEAALDKARAFDPQVCFLDIGLPDMDGNELARRLRRLPGLEGIRLAAMTGYGQPFDRLSSAAAGIDAYFVKPVAMDELARWLAEEQAA